MYLQRLDIQGFKSFAQKTSFLFPAPKDGQKGITAVVGPNGSGKSNVADAIRWVLGEQSKLLLRSKRAEDVIFFGSAKKTQLGFCEVSLVLNNEDRAVPLDFTEIVLTRRLYRDGESEFLINNSKVRLSDVALLAAQAQLGSRTVSVIGQGMIEGIINASPAERKEYFAEAAGVKQYQLKKDQAVAKLKGTQENLVQARTVLAELEPKIKFFHRQIKRMEERGAVESEYRETARVYYNALWNDLRLQIQECLKKRTGIETSLHQDQDAYRVLEQEFSRVEQTSRAREGFKELQREYEQQSRSIQSLTQRKSLLEGRMQSHAEQSGEGKIAWVMGRLAEIDGTIARIDGEQKDCAQQRDTLLQQEAEAVKELEEWKRNQPAMTNAVSVSDDELRKELEELSGALSDQELESASLQSLKDVVVALRGRIRTLLGRFSSRFSSAPKPDASQKDLLVEQLNDVRRERAVVESKLSMMKREYEQTLQEKQRLEKDRTYFTSGNATAQQKALQEEIAELVEQLAAASTRIESVRGELAGKQREEQESSRGLLELQRTMSAQQKTIDRQRDEMNACVVSLARLETHREELVRKINEDLSLESHHLAECLENPSVIETLLESTHESFDIDRASAKQTLDRLKRRLEAIGSVDPEIMTEYEETQKRFDFLNGQVVDLDAALSSLRAGITELNGIIREQFDVALGKIDSAFQEYFRRLFSGGTGRISVVRRETLEQEEDEDEKDTRNEWEQGDDIVGVEIFATPPDKKLKNLSALSGGEKAMTAIALMCAIISNNPSPFVVLDEVDAALDDSNANRFAAIVSELATQTQFILITHNRVTIHTAQVLYGVTMGDDGISKVLSLDIERAGAIVRQS